MRRKRKKPSRPPSHIVFPKHGAPVPVAEPLPLYGDDLELVIVEKFARALRERFGRTLSAPTRGDRWPDFWTTEGSDKVGIEVTEVVNRDHIAAAKGYGVSQSVEVARRLLLSRIESKIAMNYAKRSTWKLWLLIYDVTQALVAEHAAAAKIAIEALRGIDHPFTEIWLIWPTAYEIPSFLESVWPTTDFTSTEMR